MRISLFLLLIVIANACLADSIDEVIHPLGLSKEDLMAIWHDGRCDPGWSIRVDSEILKDKALLGNIGLKAGFFEREDSENRITLRSGGRCVALNQYYFQGTQDADIDEFIGRDKSFIEKYGYSVLDAVYVERTQFYSWNGDVGEFRLNHAKELARKGLFTLKQEASKFNGKPSVAFSGRRTAAGDQFHDKVFQ
jgi:hypothetical protein